MERAVEEGSKVRLPAGAEFMTGQRAHPQAAGRGPGLFHRFLLWSVLLPLALYLLIFPLVRWKSYASWTPSVWTGRLDYAFNSANRNADVLVFGDSSAFISVDPRLVDKELGTRTFILPGVTGSLPITGDIVLNRYLATNPPPRLLVLYFNAWSLDYLNAPNTHSYEGVEMLARHGTWEELGSFGLHNPMLLLTFPLRTYSRIFDKQRLSMIHRRPASPDESGHFEYNDPVPAESTPCTMIQVPVLSDTGQQTVQDLISRYSSKMKVVVYIAPIPSCVNASPILNRSYARLNALPPVVLPPDVFFADNSYAHIRTPFVPQASHLLAQALRGHLREAGIVTSQASKDVPQK